MDTITRNNYGRLFKGVMQNISYASAGDLITAVFDRVYMPALVIEDGKQLFQSFSIDQNQSQSLQLPQDYDSDNKLYVAIETNGKAKVSWDSPTHGNTQAVLLNATDSDSEGTHKALWCYQGDVSAMSISIPSTANGGVLTDVNIFMYELPDLEVYTSYFDKQIGLGITETL